MYNIITRSEIVKQSEKKTPTGNNERMFITMLVSDSVAKLIEQLLSEGGGKIEVRRSDLADRIGCAPSQINYVITSRFTPERGYLIESKRGGGGYIRIVKKQLSKDQYLMHCFCAIGDEIDEGGALAILKNFVDNGFISPQQASTGAAAISARALAGVEPEKKKIIRADIFRQLILSFMK